MSLLVKEVVKLEIIYFLMFEINCNILSLSIEIYLILATTLFSENLSRIIGNQDAV